MVELATSDASIARCFDVMHELRPMLKSADDFVEQVKRQQREGYRLAYLEEETAVVTVAGFRVHGFLSTGRTLYVDDLVTGEPFRSKGHGKTMLDWLIAKAREEGCQTLSLDSGTQRQTAHAFYFREGMRISSFHFSLPLM
jgi:GNAT superfamily N-acetyltransferase